MPEDKKMAVEKENTSPAKSKTPTISRSGNTLAHVTMLDGSVLDVNIEVRRFHTFNGKLSQCMKFLKVTVQICIEILLPYSVITMSLR